MTEITLNFHETEFAVVARNGQNWLTGWQIASALGYQNPNSDSSKLYSRHSDEFTDGMTQVVKMMTAGGYQDVRVFSLRGAHLLAMFARTERAAEFRRWVLDVLDRQGKPVAAVRPAPTFPNHSADRLVASDRSFRALMRSAKAIGYSPEEAMRMARDGAARMTGMDVLGELGVAYEATLTPREALQRFVATYDPAPYWDSDKGQYDQWEAYNCAYLMWCKERKAKPVPYEGFCSATAQSGRRA